MIENPFEFNFVPFEKKNYSEFRRYKHFALVEILSCSLAIECLKTEKKYSQLDNFPETLLNQKKLVHT